MVPSDESFSSPVYHHNQTGRTAISHAEEDLVDEPISRRTAVILRTPYQQNRSTGQEVSKDAQRGHCTVNKQDDTVKI
jgi:hypothetical protein